MHGHSDGLGSTFSSAAILCIDIVIKDISVLFFVDPANVLLPLDAVAHICSLFVIVDSVQGHTNYVWNFF